MDSRGDGDLAEHLGEQMGGSQSAAALLGRGGEADATLAAIDDGDSQHPAVTSKEETSEVPGQDEQAAGSSTGDDDDQPEPAAAQQQPVLSKAQQQQPALSKAQQQLKDRLEARSRLKQPAAQPAGGGGAPRGEQPKDSAKQEEQEEERAGWSASYLYGKADKALTALLDSSSLMAPQRLCAADEFSLGLKAPEVEQLLADLVEGPAPRARAGPLWVSGVAHNLPCGESREGGRGACCDHPVSFRKNTTDYRVFKQVLRGCGWGAVMGAVQPAVRGRAQRRRRGARMPQPGVPPNSPPARAAACRLFFPPPRSSSATTCGTCTPCLATSRRATSWMQVGGLVSALCYFGLLCCAAVELGTHSCARAQQPAGVAAAPLPLAGPAARASSSSARVNQRASSSSVRSISS